MKIAGRDYIADFMHGKERISSSTDTSTTSLQTERKEQEGPKKWSFSLTLFHFKKYIYNNTIQCCLDNANAKTRSLP